MPTTTTLDCRLLCASNVADEISAKTGYKPKACYFDPVGFTSPPTIIVGGPKKIDACLVGTSGDGVILAFRGTIMPGLNWPSIYDWLQDFLVVPEAVPGLPGKVHMGFYNSVKAIWNPMLAEVQRQIPGKELIITGHSKGASMATLASMMLHEAGITAQTVTSFACPNTGDAAFASGYKKVFKQNMYLNHLDMIPFLPPTPDLAKILEKIPKIGFLFKFFDQCGYQPATDDGIYIPASGANISQATSPFPYAMAKLGDLADIQAAAKTGLPGILKILGAHMPGCGGGYMQGVCGSMVDCSSPDCQAATKKVGKPTKSRNATKKKAVKK